MSQAARDRKRLAERVSLRSHRAVPVDVAGNWEGDQSEVDKGSQRHCREVWGDPKTGPTGANAEAVWFTAPDNPFDRFSGTDLEGELR
jgi:hypothetical protein